GKISSDGCLKKEQMVVSAIASTPHIIHARYCRRIPALTETAARPGESSARVCGDNQKRYTPGFTALTERGVVPSWSLVRCDGGRSRMFITIN
ncbi:hypothetical protein, partial [Escherichia coli]